jgi:hypothetical protein
MKIVLGEVHQLIEMVSVKVGRRLAIVACGVELEAEPTNETSGTWTGWQSLVTCSACRRRNKNVV